MNRDLGAGRVSQSIGNQVGQRRLLGSASYQIAQRFPNNNCRPPSNGLTKGLDGGDDLRISWNIADRYQFFGDGLRDLESEPTPTSDADYLQWIGESGGELLYRQP